ncbi:NosD domain-containing protein [Paenarthrobacter sp. NPDC058040]|uniref:NosD domain-containing protein n=1 Tax=unclassified Paenarthrobacter TaxID=2634190 RepID=UPI0036DD73B0
MADAQPARRRPLIVALLIACACLFLTSCQPSRPTESKSPQREAAAPSDLDRKSTVPNTAKGDGITDDTAALQSWLNAGGGRLSNGTFRITKGLVLNGDNRTLQTDNATIVADASDITVLTVAGKNAKVGVHIDGRNHAAYGLKVTGAGATIEDGIYENFWSKTQSARGIDATTSYGVVIRDNIIRNVVSVGDGIGGNNSGASRGIALNSTADAKASSFIMNNRLENITGEEGDAIHVLFNDGKSSPFNAGRVKISDNEVRNVSRRFIKVQASSVVVEGNKLHTDADTEPTNPSAAIDIIRSENVKVLDNQLDPDLTGGGIAVNGISSAPLRGIEVRGNVLRESNEKSAVGIYLNWTVSPVVRDNTVIGVSAGIEVRASTGAEVEGNAHEQSAEAAPGSK